jgi:hypothetical protein
MATELNSDDVQAAHALVTRAAQSLTDQLKAKGYPHAEVYRSDHGFSVYLNGMSAGAMQKGFGNSFAAAADLVASVQTKPVGPRGTPSPKSAMKLMSNSTGIWAGDVPSQSPHQGEFHNG